MDIITNKNFWFSTILKLAFTLIFCSFITSHANDKPYYNYDAIPYVAAAKLIQNDNIEESHKYAYQLLKEKAPQFYNGLCCSSSYRKSMSSDFEAFESHLPAYQIKSLYVNLIRLTSDVLNVDEFRAINLISLSSVIGIVLIFVGFFFHLNIFAFLSIFGVLILSQVLHLSRLMTPDALSSFIFLSSVIAIIKNKQYLGFSLIFAALLIRPSNIVYAGLIPLFLVKDKKYISFLVVSCISLLIYFLNSKLVDGLGWWKSFHSSLIGMPTTFIGYAPEFSLDQYFNSLNYWFFWVLADWNYNRWLAITAIFVFSGLYLMQKEKGYLKNEILIFTSLSIGVVISFMLFPIADHRIYTSGLIPATFLFTNFLLQPSKN